MRPAAPRAGCQSIDARASGFVSKPLRCAQASTRIVRCESAPTPGDGISPYDLVTSTDVDPSRARLGRAASRHRIGCTAAGVLCPWYESPARCCESSGAAADRSPESLGLTHAHPHRDRPRRPRVLHAAAASPGRAGARRRRPRSARLRPARRLPAFCIRAAQAVVATRRPASRRSASSSADRATASRSPRTRCAASGPPWSGASRPPNSRASTTTRT